MDNYRVIPILLLHEKGLVKTTKFTSPKYIGDPINAIKIFNEKEIDELIFLDIDASKNNLEPDYNLLSEIASECFMPLGYGGGITKVEQVSHILDIGIEKVVINSSAISNPKLVYESSKVTGKQSIVVSIDIKNNWLGNRKIFSHSGLDTSNINVIEFIKIIEDNGAGELIINSVDNDGMMAGYDIEFLKEVTESVNIPVVACGGAGKIIHFQEAINCGKCSAVAAGSMFVFHGPHKAVLINYPDQKKLENIF